MSTPIFYRICPGCGIRNNPDVMRCQCGTPQAGVDLTAETPPPPAPPPPASQAPQATAGLVCPFPDCAQTNPPGSMRCMYCDRPLSAAPSLINLPGALSNRFRIIETMPAKGAEAELLVVQALGSTTQLVAKIYRHGILPKTAVQERIARIDRANRVEVLEFGVSDGYAYELMEYCRGGSLRGLLDQPGHEHGVGPALVQTIAAELAQALADIHRHGLVHRDLKPENILIRSQDPLDLVLTDFGIASLLDVTQRYTGVAHTLPYAAPESLSGVIDAKADYWALGMIILEASTGAHPFKNLSDAVILHYLTTKNIVTTDIVDQNIGKLVRGLLLRDPAVRWGAAELQRWLVHDATLAEPINRSAQNQVDQTYLHPYQLGAQHCTHAEQLGVALAHQWEMGVGDIINGQLLIWFRDVQKDQNTVRLLLDLRSRPSTSVDVQLLTLILHLAPGIPAVWQGQSIALSAILKQVSAALRGDDKAAQLLNQLYQNKVLEIYAAAGNQAAADIVQRWNKTCDLFVPAWETKNELLVKKSARPDAPANIDQLMYGNSRLNRPYLASMHARILAFCYDSNWAQRVRQSVQSELTTLAAQCPWMTELGDPALMSPVDLLVTECLLPELRTLVQRQEQHSAGAQAQQLEECQTAGKHVSAIISQIRVSVRNSALNNDECERLSALCHDYFKEVATIRASGRVDLPWMEMRKSVLRYERKVNTLMEKINRLAEHNVVNAGWINQRTIGYALCLMLFLILPARRSAEFSLNGTMLFAELAAVAAFLLWRFVPVFLWKQQIRETAANL